jgi:hypothetical protein
MYYLFIGVLILTFTRSLGADDFENLQELDIQDFEQQLAGKQDK